MWILGGLEEELGACFDLGEVLILAEESCLRLKHSDTPEFLLGIAIWEFGGA